MIIDIKQHRIAIGDAYDIYTNNKRSFSAYTKLLTVQPVIHLAEYGSDRIELTIQAEYSLFGPSYLILRNGKEYTFETISMRESWYQCMVGDTCYDLYRHVDNDCSVFKNDVQVAYWTGQSITFLEGDKYQIQADDNCNAKFLIAFCLILDSHYHSGNGGSLFSFNFSLFGWKKHEADKNWKPK